MLRRIVLAAVTALGCACAPEAGPSRLIVAAPMTGDMSGEGQGLERSVRMAVADEAAETGLAPVEIVVLDDRADPFEAAAAARRAVDDPSVFAVIGHLTSGCAIEASRVYAQAPLAMITPSATATQLTAQQDAPGWGGERVVFRLPPSDDVQGEYAAGYAVQRLSLKRFVLVHDRTPYGLGLAEAFRGALERKGGKALSFEPVSRGDKDFSAAVAVIAAERPEAIFFGGLYMEAALLLKQLRASGWRGTFLSGDGAKNPELFAVAGPAVDGAYFSVGGVPVESLPSAADFVERYQKLYAGAAPRTFDHYGYVAARVALEALRKAGGPDRRKVLEAVRGTSRRSMVGTIVFDSKGDTLSGLVTMTRADFARQKFEVTY
ncbi:MAG: branched-chain amino acid ABC transporter substrate-binding protein [Elusimicrobiota bacterium]|nr:branched-chain amino acid ABC transporter substrate-binding protein [Elusimicrobiota bacterium]